MAAVAASASVYGLAAISTLAALQYHVREMEGIAIDFPARASIGLTLPQGIISAACSALADCACDRATAMPTCAGTPQFFEFFLACSVAIFTILPRRAIHDEWWGRLSACIEGDSGGGNVLAFASIGFGIECASCALRGVICSGKWRAVGSGTASTIFGQQGRR